MKIEDIIPGLKICPKCLEVCCFLLPDFNFETGEILPTKSCPRCKGDKNETKSP